MKDMYDKAKKASKSRQSRLDKITGENAKTRGTAKKKAPAKRRNKLGGY